MQQFEYTLDHLDVQHLSVPGKVFNFYHSDHSLDDSMPARMTFIVTDDAIGLHINGVDYVTVKNLTVDGDAQTDGVGEPCSIKISTCDYILLSQVEWL